MCKALNVMDTGARVASQNHARFVTYEAVPIMLRVRFHISEKLAKKKYNMRPLATFFGYRKIYTGVE